MDIFQQETSKVSSLKILYNKSTNATALQLIIVVIASIAVYSNALFNSFVFDDSYQVLDNRWIRDIRFIPTIFSHSVWGFDTSTSVLQYYRPMMHLIYMLIYRVFGLNPFGFHLVNILFHTGVSVLVFILAKHLLTERHSSTLNTFLSPAFIAAILFATHPIHTEVVSWVAAVPELSFTFFYLLSFYLYVRSEEDFRGGYSLSLLSFTLSLFSKETALTLPIVIGAYDYAFKRDGSRYALEYLKRYLPYLVIVGLYLVVRSYGLRDVAPAKKVFDLGVGGYVINVCSFFVQYLGKLILPIHLNAYHVFRPISSILESDAVLALIVTMAVAVLIFVSLKKSRVVFWCLILVIVPLIPTFYIIGNTEVGISERYLYLPSFGFVLLLALLVDRIRIIKPKMSILIGITLSVLIGLYSFGTIRRNSTWKDEYIFWTDTSRKSPDSEFVHRAFGGVLFNRGSIDEALEEFLVAVRLNPNDAIAHTGLAAAFNRKGVLDRSVEHYNIAIQLKPSYWEAHCGLGTTYINMGKVDDGIGQLDTCLMLKPEFADAHKNICFAYMSKGMISQAIEHCQAGVKLAPNDADAHYNLALAYKTKGLINNAIDEYEVALRLKPIAAAHNNLGMLYSSQGMSDKAIEHYQAAIRLQPNDAKAYNNLGIVYAKMRLIDNALECLENAVRIEPDNQGFRRNLERVYAMGKSSRKETH